VSEPDKSLESWIWDAACSIRGAKDAPKYKEFILPLIFAKRLSDVFDDEVTRIAKEVGSRAKAFKLVKHDKKLVRFYLPLEPKNPDDTVWSVIRTLSDKIGEQLTTHSRAIADANPLLKGLSRGPRCVVGDANHGVLRLFTQAVGFFTRFISLFTEVVAFSLTTFMSRPMQQWAFHPTGLDRDCASRNCNVGFWGLVLCRAAEAHERQSSCSF
jgi:hypothetical protein